MVKFTLSVIKSLQSSYETELCAALACYIFLAGSKKEQFLSQKLKTNITALCFLLETSKQEGENKLDENTAYILKFSMTLYENHSLMPCFMDHFRCF